MLDQGLDDPAFILLLADALKPRRGETLPDLRARFDSTVARTPRGAEAMLLLDQHDQIRANRYRNFRWRTCALPLAQIRVWPGMEGLPGSWCERSVEETAWFVKTAGGPVAGSRLSRMLGLRSKIGMTELVEWLTCLPLPVLPDHLLHRRPPCPGAPWALDDGCARAVTLSLLGVSSVAVILGEPLDGLGVDG